MNIKADVYLLFSGLDQHHLDAEDRADGGDVAGVPGPGQGEVDSASGPPGVRGLQVSSSRQYVSLVSSGRELG